jgi:hypothetical protein
MIQVQLNLPTTTNSGKSTKKILDKLEIETCEKFGGMTVFKIPLIFRLRLALFKIFNVKNAEGLWLDKNKLYRDKIKIFQIAIEKKDKKKFVAMCKKYGKLTKQLAIYLVINNKPKIINI